MSGAPPAPAQACSCCCPTFSPNGHQLNPLAGDEVQGLVDIGDFMEAHLAFIWPGQPLSWV